MAISEDLPVDPGTRSPPPAASNDPEVPETQSDSSDVSGLGITPPATNNIETSHPETVSTPFRDWRDSALKLLLEVKNYWSDRQTILADTNVLRNGRTRLQTKPFGFAFNGVLLPSLVLAFLYSCIGAVYDLPKPQIERAIEEQKNLQKILDDAIANKTLFTNDPEPTWAKTMSTEQIEQEINRLEVQLKQFKAKPRLSRTDKAQKESITQKLLELIPVPSNRSMRDLQATMAAAQKEAVHNRLMLLTVTKFANIVNSWRDIIIGLSLVMNAYLFSWWIKRLRPPLAFLSSSTDAHLYTLGTMLLFPGIATAVLNTGLDISIRYDVNWFLAAHPYLTVGMSIWVVVQLVRAGRLLQRVLDETPQTRKLGRVTWRLLGSQFAIAIVIQVVVATVAIPLFWFVSKFQK